MIYTRNKIVPSQRRQSNGKKFKQKNCVCKNCGDVSCKNVTVVLLQTFREVKIEYGYRENASGNISFEWKNVKRNHVKIANNSTNNKLSFTNTRAQVRLLHFLAVLTTILFLLIFLLPLHTKQNSVLVVD